MLEATKIISIDWLCGGFRYQQRRDSQCESSFREMLQGGKFHSLLSSEPRGSFPIREQERKRKINFCAEKITPVSMSQLNTDVNGIPDDKHDICFTFSYLVFYSI